MKLYTVKNTKKARKVLESMGYKPSKSARPALKSYLLKSDGELNITDVTDDFDYLRFTSDSNIVLVCDKSHYKTYKTEIAKIKFKQLQPLLASIRVNQITKTCNELSIALGKFSSEVLHGFYKNSGDIDES